MKQQRQSGKENVPRVFPSIYARVARATGGIHVHIVCQHRTAGIHASGVRRIRMQPTRVRASGHEMTFPSFVCGGVVP
jgi:hypothetical protein